MRVLTHRSASSGYSTSDESSGAYFAEVSSLSAFNRFSLGQNISLNANTIISLFPIFERARLTIVQRNVFENTYEAQTLGRGGFILLPRGLEVRLVAKNSSSSPMAAGLVGLPTNWRYRPDCRPGSHILHATECRIQRHAGSLRHGLWHPPSSGSPPSKLPRQG